MAWIKREIKRKGVFSNPNSTMCPNDLIDYYMVDMGASELKVVLAIVRYTFGYHRRERKITLSTLESITGLCRNSVLIGASKAEDRGLISKALDENGECIWTVNMASNVEDGLENRRKKMVQKVNRPGAKSEPPAVQKVNRLHYIERNKRKSKETDFSNSQDQEDPLPSPLLEMTKRHISNMRKL